MSSYHTLHGLSSEEDNRKPNTSKKNKSRQMLSPADNYLVWLDRMIGDAGIQGGIHDSNSCISAGHTYLGQFLAHDISFFKHLEPKIPPRLNLHVLYGMGPGKSANLYEFPLVNPEYKPYPYIGAKMSFWKGVDYHGKRLYDFNRLENGMPIIGDARNDENFILSQLHIKFIEFHNFCAETIYARFGYTGFKLFQKTRQLVIWHYQTIIVHDYLKLLVGKDLINDLVKFETDKFKIYSFTRIPKLRKEFTEAAFRMGHSQVRNFYQLTTFNKEHNQVPLFSKNTPDKIDLTGFKRDLRRNIDWELFFDLSPPKRNGEGDCPRADHKHPKLQDSRAIDDKIAVKLYNLPFEDLTEKNLVKIDIERNEGINIKWIKNELKIHGLNTYDDQLVIKNVEQEGDLKDFASELIGQEKNHLPLWLYILMEARLQENGKKLGNIGGRIVAEQILWVIKKGTYSIFNKYPLDKKKIDLPINTCYTIGDLLSKRLMNEEILNFLN